MQQVGSHCAGGDGPEGCVGVTAVEGPEPDACCAACGARVWFAITSSNSSDLRSMISILGFCTALSRPSSLKASSPVVISAAIAAIAHPAANGRQGQHKNCDCREDTRRNHREGTLLLVCTSHKAYTFLYPIDLPTSAGTVYLSRVVWTTAVEATVH